LINKFIDIAVQDYANHGVDFYHEHDWHVANGWVVNMPHYFGMGYFYREDGKTVLHVSYVAGDMHTLFRFSSSLVLDIIEFKRNFNGRVKRYPIDKFEKRMELWAER